MSGAEVRGSALIIWRQAVYYLFALDSMLSFVLNKQFIV